MPTDWIDLAWLAALAAMLAAASWHDMIRARIPNQVVLAGIFTAFLLAALPGGIGVRVDTWAYSDCVIPPYYDSLVAKLICHAPTRQEAIQRSLRALDMFIVEGIHTSIPLHQRILQDPEFQAGDIDTGFIARFLEKSKVAGS